MPDCQDNRQRSPGSHDASSRSLRQLAAGPSAECGQSAITRTRIPKVGILSIWACVYNAARLFIECQSSSASGTQMRAASARHACCAVLRQLRPSIVLRGGSTRRWLFSFDAGKARGGADKRPSRHRETISVHRSDVYCSTSRVKSVSVPVHFCASVAIEAKSYRLLE